VVDFLDSYMGWEPNGGSHYARCVRGGPISGAFTLSGGENAAVTDGRTGLTWQRNLPPGLNVWVAALSYCEGLTLLGEDDWRLPSVKELLTILSDVDSSPAIDQSTFGITEAADYWTSTPRAAIPDHIIVIDFADGRTELLGPINQAGVTARTRCVR
jgi:hypothetical protein